MRIKSKITDPRRKLAGGAIFIFSLALLPVTMIHELGHYLVCKTSGHDCIIGMNYQGAFTICNGEPSSLFLYSVSGGLLAAAVALAPVILYKRLPIYAMIACIALGLPELGKALLEGFANDTYISGILSAPVLAAYFSTLGLLIVYFIRRMPKKELTAGKEGE